MTVLVCYASRHGATAGIAKRLAEVMETSGLDVDCRPVDEVDDVDHHEAFVIGGAAYMFHWLKDVTRFVKRNRTILAARPVWLFSSGPLGTDLVDEQGRDVFEASRPKEFDQLEALVEPVETRVFFGAWDPDAPPVGLGERVVRMMPAAKNAMPAGDFRDWPAIEEWAREISSTLTARSSSSQ